MARLYAEITDKNLNKVMAHEAEKISPIFVYYRIALQRDFLLGYLSCRVHVFSCFYGFETFEKLVSKLFLFILFFFCALKCELNNFRVC